VRITGRRLPLIVRQLRRQFGRLFFLGQCNIADGIERILKIIVDVTPALVVIIVLIQAFARRSTRCFGCGIATSKQALKRQHLGRRQLGPTSPRQPAGQRHRPEAQPHQTADRQPDHIEHAPDFAITPFADHHAIPGIRPVAAQIFDHRKHRRPILERHAFEQSRANLVVDSSENSHCVFTLPAVARVHELIGDIAGGSENQQPLGVEVQTPDRHPARALQARQSFEDRRAARRIVAGADLSRWFVIEQHPWRQCNGRPANRTAVYANLIIETDPLSDMGRLAVDRYPASDDQFLHITARTQTRVSEKLVQFG
jgi:hypothetical protein